MKDKMKENKRMVIAAICVVLAALFLTVIFWGLGSGQRKLNSFLDLGQKYLEDMAYEDAILVFDEAIAIDPKCAEAYLGKAQAQYALGQVDEAISTLREGIEKVDDGTELEAYLQQILDELETAAKEAEKAAVEAAKAEAPLVLNYSEIVRKTDTEDPEIQLEVLGGESPENYTWESDNLECAVVSDTGLVTCKPIEGYATILVSNKYGKSDICNVYINDYEWIDEHEVVRFEAEDQEKDGDRFLMAVPVEDGMRIDQVCSSGELSEWVYYSGDVVIPEHLTYRGQTVPVTEITHLGGNKGLKSLSIPSTVSEVEYGLQGCLTLEKVEVAKENPYYQSVDGVLFSKDGKELLVYPALRPGNSYMVPREVESISDGAFTGCKNLTEILVEEGNTNYKSVDGVLMTEGDEGGDCLFAYPMGKKAARYVVPESVTELADDAFYGSILEDVVCKSVTYIYSSSFAECSKLRRLEGGSATRSISVYSSSVVEIAGVEEMNDLESLSIGISYGQEAQTANLQKLGQLKSLKSLDIRGIKDSAGLTWLKELQNLETVYLTGVEMDTADLSILQELPNVNKLGVGLIKNLSDISWIEGMQNLSALSVEADNVGVEDFTGLLEMPNLRNVSITSNTHHDGIKEQFEKMQEENTDRYFSYYEYEGYE